jgi:apolipoprotein D and lipocalin family protein
MGTWYVIGHVPTFLDKNTSNGVETYTWNEETQCIDVLFSYMNVERTKTSHVEQKAWAVNEANSRWQLQLKLGFIPISMPYLILACDPEYSTCVIGVPDRSVLYIMARSTSLPSDVYERLLNMSESAGYDRNQIKEVPQIWDPQVHEEPTGKVVREADIDETYMDQRLVGT